MWRSGSLLLALPLLAAAVAPLGWPTGTVKHRYFDTPRGQLHYVVSGNLSDVSGGLPMLLLHSHPRSTVEFRYFVEELKIFYQNPHVPFLAIDWFGLGYSEDYSGADANDKFCTFETFAGFALEIASSERMEKFAAVGHMKGAHPTIELAYQAGAARVNHVILMNPLILNPTQKAFIDSKLVPMLQNEALMADGSHLMQAWTDPSAAPMGPNGKPWNNSRDLIANQEKTNDELRCLSTGWQYDAAWTDFNDKNEARMAALDVYAKSLFIYGNVFLSDDVKYGLDPTFSLESFGKALTHGHNSTHFLEGAGQGMLIQNSTIIANLVVDFLKTPPSPSRTLV